MKTSASSRPPSRLAAAPAPILAWPAWLATAIVTVALLLAAHPGRAAAPAGDAAPIGRWVADKNDPGGAYVVAAGPAAGTLRVTVPAKAIGRPAAETLLLQRGAPGVFATAKGAAISAKFKVTDPRHAQFSLYRVDKKGVGMIFILLYKL
jgi:hypothetical protein